MFCESKHRKCSLPLPYHILIVWHVQVDYFLNKNPMPKFTLKSLFIGFLLPLTACSKLTTITPSSTSTPTLTPQTTSLNIVIGYVGPLTGDKASIGKDEQRAVDMFLATKNSLLNGQKMEVKYEDSVCNGPNAANAVNTLISNDKVQVILGGVCSEETLAMAPIANQNKVVIFNSSSGSPAIKNAGDYIFRNWPSDQEGASDTINVTLDESRPIVKTFIEESKANGISNFAHAATTYDAINIIYNAIADVGNDGEKINQWLYNMSKFEGIAGTYRFDSDGETTLPLINKIVKKDPPKQT